MKRENKHLKGKRMKEEPKSPRGMVDSKKKGQLKTNKKVNKKKLTKKQIFKRIIGTPILAIVFLLLIITSGLKYLWKLIKKYYKYIIVSVIIIAMTIGIVISLIQLNEVKSNYNNYINNTQNTINELNNTLDTYKQQLESYKEELSGKQEETNTRIDELDKKVTSRSSTERTTTTTSKTQPTSELQEYAHNLCINQYGWTEADFTCLVKLWNRESNWNPNAHNSSSGAHGIPQSLPANKMASEGDDYYTNGETQIRWGLKYISNRYGNPTNAWAHSESHNWY